MDQPHIVYIGKICEKIKHIMKVKLVIIIMLLPIFAAFTPAPLRFYIPQTTALFHNMHDETFSATISPQWVYVAEINGDWLQVGTAFGLRWIYLNFTPPTYELDAYFRQYGNSLAVFYKNIATGFTYTFNPDRVFFGASVPKLNHALYVYTLAERGYIYMDTMRPYTRADFWGGTGIMRHMPFGGYFTTRELLGNSIVDSDNVAFRMLVREYNPAHFRYRDFVYELGADLSLIRDTISQNITARDAGIWAYATFRYLESGGRYAHYLKEDLLNATVGFIVSDYPVAQKYGWYHRHFHDLAIVYADSPYILVVLSNRGVEGGAHIYNRRTAAHYTFEEISWLIQEFHDKWFSGANNQNVLTPAVFDR